MSVWFVTWLAAIGFGLLVGLVLFVVALVLQRRQRRRWDDRRRRRARLDDHEGKP